MKQFAKKGFSFVLALLLACAPLAALAGSGPAETISWLRLYVLDENERQVTELHYGLEEDVYLPLYEDGRVSSQPGAVYDPAANTLTLTDFDGGRYGLGVCLMGDDFTVEVRGECTLSYISVQGGEMFETWSCALRIAGNGRLRINPNRKKTWGVTFRPAEEPRVDFVIGNRVTVEIGGSQDYMYIDSCRSKVTALHGNRNIQLQERSPLIEVQKTLAGYTDPGRLEIIRCKNAEDPAGVYGMSDPTGDHVVITRYVYLATFNLYVEDFTWSREHATADAQVKYDSEAAAAAAGFTAEKDKNGYLRQTLEVLNICSLFNVFSNAKGDQYAMMYDYSSGKEVAMALSIAPIAEIPDMYALFYDPDVDADSLTPVLEEISPEGLYYYLPDRTWSSFQPYTMRGDVDDDGKLTAADARLALRRAVNLESFSADTDQFGAADVNCDEKVTAADARLILRAAVELEDPASWYELYW